ncbi:MAG: hypothetical protein ACFFGZ_16515 [Candidatus Thorarchaeota archaeon]
MPEKAVLDTSFLINIKKLGCLDLLCDVFAEVILSPEVWKESFQFHKELESLSCISLTKMSAEENQLVEQLHEEFTETFPGKHRGEIETLVIAKVRRIQLVISDNFAPWFIRRIHSEFENIKIFRGMYFFSRIFELEMLNKDFLDKLRGIYPEKEITRLREAIE